VVEACARPRRDGPPVQVIVAGSGELGPAMAERAAALGVRLHALGFQNQSRMPAVYAAADVLMLPSDAHETWGLVCNEALACGRPILVSDQVGCAEDLAQDGVAGRVFAMGDIRQAADQLDDLLRAPPSQAAIAARAMDYSLSAAADGVITAATTIISRRRG
jgi:glycosyltransferase involved in cell wall biosynthesis